MKTGISVFILVTFAGVICNPVFGQTGTLPGSEMPELIDPVLIGKANPALEGIKKLYIVIEPANGQPNEEGLVWRQVRDKIKYKLRRANIEIVDSNDFEQELRSPDIAELRVQAEMFKFNNSRLYVFHIQTSLAVKAYLEKQGLFFKADVWRSEPVMEVVSLQNMPSRVTKEVLSQVEAFVSAHSAANSQLRQVSDVNNVKAALATAPKKKTVLSAEATAESKYVASKNSKVFHRPECGAVKRISEENLVSFNSSNEAIKTGRRPCKLCKP